ncbi:MAG: radical SAM protein [Candidatus Aenigmarchaeota archaeon]|nr:radical SAM protein [Candidatus Aenigmarchaeota archaeon]MDI6721977.1 radical SAM protein [Candidatus Aenigmarchaeota archaeon]
MVRILFLQGIWFEFEGIMGLSAALKTAGHTVDIIIGTEWNKILPEIKAYDPDIIAISMITSYRQYALEMAKNVKESGLKAIVFVGGYDASFFPQIIEQCENIDVLCVGEGDEPMVELANCLDNGEDYSDIMSLWLRKGGQVIKNPLRPLNMDMDSKSWEDRDIYRKYPFFKDFEFAQVMVGRGCPHLCSYCYNHQYRRMYAEIGSKKYTHLRSVENVIGELLILKNKYGYKSIFFNDSTLTYDKRWLLAFCKRYKEEIDLPFTINGVVSEIDEEICQALADTKQCYLIRFGLESGDEKFRLGVMNRTNTNDQYYKATALMQKYGLRYSMQFMLGLPGETLEMSYKTLEMAAMISGKDSVHAVNVFKPYPKLDITEYGINMGVYDRSLFEDVNSPIGSNRNNIYSNFRQDEEGRLIQNLSRFAHLYIRYPWMRPAIKKLIKYPDNRLYRLLWRMSETYYTGRNHTKSSWKFAFKYVFKHFTKSFR